jgi:hypothetical protein
MLFLFRKTMTASSCGCPKVRECNGMISIPLSFSKRKGLTRLYVRDQKDLRMRMMICFSKRISTDGLRATKKHPKKLWVISSSRKLDIVHDDVQFKMGYDCRMVSVFRKLTSRLVYELLE